MLYQMTLMSGMHQFIFFYHCMLSGLLHCICMCVKIIKLKLIIYILRLYFHEHAVDTETTTTVMTADLLPSTTELQFETNTSMITKTVSGSIYESMNIPPLKCTATGTSIPEDQSVLANQRETTTAWTLFAMILVLDYKKRQMGGENGQHSEFEIEGNPCYEATEMKQSSEREAHVYEIIR